METLIINKRHELPRTKKLIWDIATILLWFGFVYLWKPLLLIFYKIITLEVPANEISNWIYDNIHSVTFTKAVFLLTATPIILFILSRLNRHIAPSEHLIYTSSDYAKYFNLSDANLKQCTDSQLVTVFFDEHGHIIKLDNKA
ncbi:poly-beta-1,6-N-acetyl-D-glucosamine biosynthesis protein PgaD [Sulfurimonas gotlandica]|jgi:poly-beta-1,6-N-acetyl-D-glucosamine biosynthesis protein PgaD|uniref:poly-beta-1,6-N-acetyl-D-glucosamine biosynthesis protein PgaD n=1 Tax=Sulfurimonas gotlandica TaxID=1176482 RepID=UPI0009D70134|nr:poly-beta-1,6-N-acetyl-D-glucosamine biosynthesis protein PgaD [Sulfurimonas gotlandica]